MPGTTSYEITIFGSEVITDADFGNQFVGDVGPNQPPKFQSTPPTDAATGGLFRYDAVATDPNHDPLAYDLVVKPQGMAVDSSSGIVVWRPRAEDVGTHDVILRVRDGRGGIDLQPFQITVGSNSPPVITSAAVQQAVADLPYQYRVRAQDPDDDVLQYRLDVKPDGMQIVPDTGVITWLPTSGDVGTHSVLIVVSDGKGAETPQSFDIEVVADAVNDPPSIDSTPRTTIQLGRMYRYQVVASDPNADPLTYYLDVKPDGMTIDQQGLIAWQPAGAQFGSTRSHCVWKMVAAVWTHRISR